MSRAHIFLIFLSIVISVFLSIPLFAQTACEPAVDPHSFACAEATFANHVFPMLPVNSNSIQGNWRLLTFSAAPSEASATFVSVKNRENPRIPVAVFNPRDRSQTGPLLLQPGQTQFLNWKQAGQNVVELPDKTKFLDPFTLEMRLNAFEAVEGLQCRLFSRQQIPHLLCRWWTLTAQNEFVLRGYFGFLRGSAREGAAHPNVSAR